MKKNVIHGTWLHMIKLSSLTYVHDYYQKFEKIITENNNNRNGLYFWQIKSAPLTAIVSQGIKPDGNLLVHSKVWYDFIWGPNIFYSSPWEGKVLGRVVIQCIKSEVLKISWVLHEKVWFWEGVPWGRNLVSSWGNLVIFDIFPPLSQCLASQIVSFAET